MYRVFFALIALVSGGCAQKTRDVLPAYVSPIQYGAYDCHQMSAEAYRITNRMTFIGGIQDEHARDDETSAGIAAVGLGAVAAGGALIGGAAATKTLATAATIGGAGTGIAGIAGIHGNDAQTSDYARLKGEIDAVERAYVARGCGMPRPYIEAAPALRLKG